MSVGVPVLALDTLTVRVAGAGEVVTGLSLEVGPGEIVGLVGESGAGKSLTALAVMGLLPRAAAATGRVVALGRDLLAVSEAEYDRVRGRLVAMVFQQPGSSLDPYQRVGAQLAATLRTVHGVARAAAAERARTLLSEVGLEPERTMTAFPHELSGGQQQRVMLALALVGEPRLLIADEATTALDTVTQGQIVELLRRLCRERGMALLFVSHDLALQAKVADRVVVVREGRVVEQGETARVLERPRDPYTRALLACRPRLASGQRRLPTIEVPDPPPAPAPRVAGAEVRPPLLVVEGLVVRYPRRTGALRHSADSQTAVAGVSFAIARGETLGLVGGSGSGKTSLALAVLRLVPARAAALTFAGIDLLAANARSLRALRRRMQIVFQDPTSALDPRQRVVDALLEGLVLHRIGAGRAARLDRAAGLLDEVGLGSSVLRRYPHQLSGGERQRVAIARALAVEPELLVCDEAVASLDVAVQAQVLNTLEDACERRQLACLFIGHDLAVVEFMADRIAVMERGRLVEVGPAAEVCQTPRSDAARALVAAAP